jgi:HAMP domain-containing protein
MDGLSWIWLLMGIAFVLVFVYAMTQRRKRPDPAADEATRKLYKEDRS